MWFIGLIGMKIPSKVSLWLAEPEDHDYPAAESYLSLIFNSEKALHLVDELRKAEMTSFKAKDIFRASGLSLLGISNLHIERNMRKVKKGTKLSPLLLVRAEALGRVIVADGYHRLCTVYQLTEDAVVPCKIT
jgi:hypothetical protein